MRTGYDQPLFILPFDHRASFSKGLFGFESPLSSEQVAAVAASKQVVYDGFKRALTMGVPPSAAAILVDEQFGADVLRDAKSNGFRICVPVEKSGQEEFSFDYGDSWRHHIDKFKPDFVKVLIRYNPGGDRELNRRQADRLRQLSEYCDQSGRYFMLEMLVPMTHEQSDRLEGDQRLYDLDLRPSLMIAAVRELQRAGVEPDVWKVEGLERSEDCAALVREVRAGGRSQVGCIILGRGADEAGIAGWLRTAASVEGFIGFAVGRTSFWESLATLRDKRISREEAVTQIASRYVEWMRVFLDARG